MRFYERPVQVVFADPENPGCGDWLNGIAFRDVIICSCCGGIFEIDEVINVAKEDGVINPIYPYADWNDLTDSVVGGMLPEGLEHIRVEDDEYKIVETASAEYEQHYFILEEEEEEQAAVFANTWVDDVAMPEVPNS